MQIWTRLSTGAAALAITAGVSLAASPAAHSIGVANWRACISPGACRPINTQSASQPVVQCWWENPIKNYSYPYSYTQCNEWPKSPKP